MSEEIETTPTTEVINGINYETYEVESGGRVVGTAKYPVYTTIEQAQDELGKNTCLKYINAQAKTNEMNRVRAASTSDVTQSKFDSMLGDLMNSPETFERYLEPLISQIQAEIASGTLAAKDKRAVFAARNAEIKQKVAAELYARLEKEGKNLSKVSL